LVALVDCVLHPVAALLADVGYGEKAGVLIAEDAG